MSFPSEQIHVSLYLSAMSSFADLVGKPTFRVNPMKGLDVMLTGSGANGAVPTALSPTVLNVNWICYTQEKESDSMRGWATFGIISCIFIVFSSLLCCGGFIYRSRVEHQDGLHALPGMTTVSAFLDASAVTARPEDQSFPWSNTTGNESCDDAFKKGASFVAASPSEDRSGFHPGQHSPPPDATSR
ncbi:hypothetical protein TRIUR3_03819 [Triticum urartu]|uniref:Transmembrane protein n=1 Tax=Triticum urartu TaxID=4572 RepID=M8A5P6_TRIUA|nr:hypothetical protein TRIUR3_03819 [Triticum urartu]